MNPLDKLIRYLKNDYKLGVEATAGAPVIYLDPNTLDSWSAKRALNTKPGAVRTSEEQMAHKILSEQVRNQLDGQSPGISSKLTEQDVEGLYRMSLTGGPFADKTLKDHNVGIINMPKGDQISPEKIFDTFGLTHTHEPEPEDPNDPYYADEFPKGSFDKRHMKPLPGSKAVWEEMAGRHEGEHIQQAPIYNDDKEAALKMLDGEIKSDRVALSGLRANGHHDVAETTTHMRALTAAEGDFTHATGIFLDQDEYKGVTVQQMDAAKEFREEMVSGVAAELKILPFDAERLRKSDPQKFASALDNAIAHDRLPTPKEINYFEKQSKIAKEMGITADELENLGADRLPDILKAHDKLKDEGAFTSSKEQNPYIKEYAEKYSTAVKKLFIEDTTPRPDTAPAATAAPTVTKRSTDQVIAAMTPEKLKEMARNECDTALHKSVADRLKITRDESIKLRYGDIEQKTKFFDAAEEELKAGNIKGEMDRTKTETEALLKKSLGVSDQEFERIKQEDSHKLSIVHDKLYKDGVVTVKYDNPHLNKEVEQEIKKGRDAIESHKKLAADLAAAKAAEKAEEDTPEPEEPTTEPEKTSLNKAAQPYTNGSYDHLSGTRPDTDNGKPQVNLSSGTTAQMRIGELKAKEYFALQADPVLAQQQLDAKATQAPAPEPEQKVALQQRPSGLQI